MEKGYYEEEGFTVNWFDPDEYGIPTYDDGVFLTNDTAIENDSKTLKAFLRASAKEFEYYKTCFKKSTI